MSVLLSSKNSISFITAIGLLAIGPFELKAATAGWSAYNYSLEGSFSIRALSGGDTERYSAAKGIDARLTRRLSDRWRAQVEFSAATHYVDSTVSSSWSFGEKSGRVYSFASQRFGLSVRRRLADEGAAFGPYLGFGVAADNWKSHVVAGDTPRVVLSPRGGVMTYDAHEFIVTPRVGVEAHVTDQIRLFLDSRVDFYTGSGAEFGPVADAERPTALVAFGVGLAIFFDRAVKPDSWSSQSSWKETSTHPRSQAADNRDSDDDGVPDGNDKCSATPRGAKVDNRGCPLDSDADGVYDGLDDCPETPPTALGWIDIYGCPVDRDFDGVSDFQDKCISDKPGAIVDALGCPVDSDDDGVADGIDDCPKTGRGVIVNDRGCPDLSVFDKTMTLHIKYASGSFEIDRTSESKLRELARLLAQAPSVRADIIGYTDDEGDSEGNRTLSERRARRVRDFLLKEGIEAKRLRAIGRGEANPIADNLTMPGRERNRRVEIVFSK